MNEQNLKIELENLSLMTLGQHLWVLHLESNLNNWSKPTACLCLLCETARIGFRSATGSLPTLEQEMTAMEKWGTGWK